MRLTQLAHQLLEQQLTPGDLTIDATAGNGYDTLQLARLVGPDGRVIAIDLQSEAITATRARLHHAHLESQCELIQADHAKLLQNLIPSHSEMVSAITFNLGYLPGSDKAVQTLTDTTLPALDACAKLLKPGGLLLVTAYRGHTGGDLEAEAVRNWMQQLQGWEVQSHEPNVTGPRIPPILWVARRSRSVVRF